MKNCEPFVFGPLFAIDTIPRLSESKIIVILVDKEMCTPRTVLIVRVEFIQEWSSPDAFSAFSRASRVASLKHKAFHISMELGAVVVPRGGKCQEIKCSLRRRVTEHSGIRIVRATIYPQTI